MKARGTQRNNPRSPDELPGTASGHGVRPRVAPRSEPLSARIRSAIAAGNGSIPFREFMRLALYHPTHGYYRSGRAAIGRHGDYFTNASVGALFGTLLARQFVEMWERLRHPAKFVIVEQGAHDGVLAGDILRATEQSRPDFHRALQYAIIEPSPGLRGRQGRELAGIGGKVVWHRSLNALAPFEGVHFSNELLDAFPVDSFAWTGTSWVERRVAAGPEGFVFVEVPVSDVAQQRFLESYPRPGGIRYAIERNAHAEKWIASVAARLTRGYVLTIDYGGARRDLLVPPRATGTLRGYAKHRLLADVLHQPGLIDLTAHVDFTALALQAERHALRLHGFVDQHHFVVGLGRLHFHDAPVTSPAAERQMRNFKTLMHPELMGTSFRAICFEKEVHDQPALAGFTFGGDARAALDLD